MKKFILPLIVCLIVSIAGAADVAKPQKRLISLDFPDTSLGPVLDILSAKTGHKFMTDTELAKKKISLRLKDVAPDEALNALLDTYNLYFVRQGDTDIYVVKSKTEERMTTVTKIFFLNYSLGKDLSPVLKQNLSRNGSICSDERSNSLVITDVANNLDQMEILLKTLDAPPLQVLLEATIIDMKVDSDFRIGTEITNLYQTADYNTSPLSLERSSVLNKVNNTGGTTGGTASTFSIPPTDILPQFLYNQPLSAGVSAGGKLTLSILSGGFNIQGFIDTVKSNSDARILSNPKLLVLNNHTASIDIVEEIPYESQSSIVGGAAQSNVSFKEVGIKMKITPQVNRDGTIIITVSPEQSFRTGESLNNTPVISTSKAETTFILKDGETAVIGGLARDDTSHTEYKIPILGDIPILGYLFKKYSQEKIRTELSILISAKIVTRK